MSGSLKGDPVKHLAFEHPPQKGRPMNRTRPVYLSSFSLAFFLSGIASTAYAAGYQLNEQSAAATGRASSVVATIKDASSVFHNPAGLTHTKGTSFLVGVTVVNPSATYEGTGLPSTNPGGGSVSQSIENDFVPVPNLYIARALSPKAYVGFGVYFPYGLRFQWANPDQFVGRTVVERLSLRAAFLTPAIALKLTDAVSVAVGVSLVPASVSLTRTLGAQDTGQVLFPTPQYSQEGKLNMSGTAFGVGANAGVQVRLLDHLRLGFSFRSAIDLSFSGDADFDIPPEAAAEIQANFPDQKGDADITLPHSFHLGVGWEDGPLTVELSSHLTLWNAYDELRINFSTGRPAESSGDPRNWSVTPAFRLGGQYELGKAVARAGFALDFSPIPEETLDPTLRDATRIIFSLGGGYDFGPVRADIAYMGLVLLSRDVAPGASLTFTDGTYPGGMVHILSTSVGVSI